MLTKMFISRLKVNIGSNPDQPRPGRLWLQNIYFVHQRLSMAFPSSEQKRIDPYFLKPFNPQSFERPKFLFRIDSHLKGDTQNYIIIVQSVLKPDWEYAFQNARILLAAPPEVREYNPVFRNGEKFAFRILVNPSKKSRDHPVNNDKYDPIGRPKQYRRIPLIWKDENQNPQSVLREWFINKTASCGFTLNDFQLVKMGQVVGYKTIIKPGDITTDKEKPGSHRLKFHSALLEGVLTITDPDQFLHTIQTGIGSGKAFGFGLLTVKKIE